MARTNKVATVMLMAANTSMRGNNHKYIGMDWFFIQETIYRLPIRVLPTEFLLLFIYIFSSEWVAILPEVPIKLLEDLMVFDEGIERGMISGLLGGDLNFPGFFVFLEEAVVYEFFEESMALLTNLWVGQAVQ